MRLFPHLSVWENIAFGLKRGSMAKAPLRPCRRNAETDPVEKFARRKPHQISGGQRQRVALARSLAKAPKLLLLDEPLGALDKKLRQDTQFELMDIQESTGTTFVIVTHDQEEAMTVASRVAVMDEGRIIQVATPDGIYETPNSVYVADFIGDVNIIEGTANPQVMACILWIGQRMQPPFLATSDAPFSDGQKAHLAIRPEKISITTEKPEMQKMRCKARFWTSRIWAT